MLDIVNKFSPYLVSYIKRLSYYISNDTGMATIPGVSSRMLEILELQTFDGVSGQFLSWVMNGFSLMHQNDVRMGKSSPPNCHFLRVCLPATATSPHRDHEKNTTATPTPAT